MTLANTMVPSETPVAPKIDMQLEELAETFLSGRAAVNRSTPPGGSGAPAVRREAAV